MNTNETGASPAEPSLPATPGVTSPATSPDAESPAEKSGLLEAMTQGLQRVSPQASADDVLELDGSEETPPPESTAEAGDTVSADAASQDTDLGSDPDELKLDAVDAPSSQTPPADAEVDLPEEITDKELQQYGKRSRKRIQQLLAQKTELQAQVEAVRPLAEAILPHGLRPDDVNKGLGLIAALNRGDFEGFLKGVAPFVDLAQQATGQALPADLQQQVSQGYITLDLARQLAASRLQSQMATGRQRQTEQQMLAERRATLANAMRKTVSDWEAATRASDPDYAAKEALVRSEVQARMATQGVPQSPEAALQMAKEAYQEINSRIAAFKPKPTSTRPAPNSASSVSAPVHTQPKTMMEAMVQGLRSAQR
jgi:endonuclease YncB( thermonuclease family)